MAAHAPTMASGQQSQASTVSLETWSRQLAPLGEAERASVTRLADWLNSRAGPAATLSKSKQRDRSPSANKVNAQTSQESAAVIDENHDQDESSAPGPSRLARVLPQQPLNDAPSYLAWLARQQTYMLESAHAQQTSHVVKLQKAAKEAQTLLDHLESARIHISELRAGARSVEEGSEDLRDEAESMVERIDHLSKLTEALSLRLSYFSILPTSTSFLSSPSLSLVTSSKFLLTLQRLDVALAFVRAHPHYRDAALYKMRFEHCVVRAGTLIRMYVMSRFSSLATETGVRLKEWDKSKTGKAKECEFDADGDPMMSLADPQVSALLYARFEEEAPQIQTLINELERRASFDSPQAATDVNESANSANEKGEINSRQSKVRDNIDEPEAEETQEVHEIFRAPEFVTLLEECRTAYLDARRSLLSGIVATCIARVEVMTQNDTRAGTHQNATSRLVERSMRFLASAARAELDLYRTFFSHTKDAMQGSSTFGAFIASMSSPLDDRIRSRIARESTIASLASLCLSLVESIDLDNETVALVAPSIASSSIKDAQERLSSMVRTTTSGKSIKQFVPTEDDLDYPAKLKRSHRRAPSIGGAGLLEAAADVHPKQDTPGYKQIDSSLASSSSVRLFATPPQHVIATWYSPLTATLQLLSQTSTALPAQTFAELANNAIEACRSNLMGAGQKMSAQGGFGAGRIGASSRLDTPLFLLRHLYILREMSASVELRLSSRATFAVDRHAAGAGASRSYSAGGVLDFGRLVETLNSLWSGLRGVPAAPDAPAPVSPTTSTEAVSRERRSSLPSLQARIERDVTSVREQIIDIIAQGVALPLRVYIDQRSRRRRESGSQPTSPLKEFTGSSMRSPPLTSPKREGSQASTIDDAVVPLSAKQPAIAKARSAMQAFVTCARTNLSEVDEALRLYIEDTRAIQGLIGPIVARIMTSYDAFANCVAEASITREDVPQLLDRNACEQMLLKYLPVAARVPLKLAVANDV